jgi:hypothetical protein
MHKMTEENKPVDLAREELEKMVGKVWNTQELQEEFTVHSFSAPFVTVTRKADGVKGILEFRHSPRFYYSFVPSN